MDTNGLPVEGYPPYQLPLGFSMSLAMNENAMQGYAKLTETEKEHLIMRCKDARSKEEMQKIVDSLANDESLNNLREEESEKLL
ncbi:MAG: hypothetical protein J6A94_07555 [Lachnospiraceae bacterium]|nr:hypothetical protein [Lachnospiraceae bacterium]